MSLEDRLSLLGLHLVIDNLIIDNFKQSGWNLNILQHPLALHICITPNNIDQLNDFKNVINHILTIDKINNIIIK